MSAVTASAREEVDESVTQWVKFCSFLPNPAKGGEVVHQDGVVIACSRTVWPMGNLAVLSDAVQSSSDLARKIKIVHNFFSARLCAGVFFTPENLIGSVRSEAPNIFAEQGYVPMMTMLGMATDALVVPKRSLPVLEFRAVSDAESRRILWELNAIAYEVPLEWGHDSDERTDIWSHSAFGIIGYLNDRPAACAVTVPIDGRLYMALVATAHQFRNLGCAEAVMRRSLADAARATGLTRTVLHASPMGRPLYSQMGYRDTLPFDVYVQAAKNSAGRER